MKHRVRAFIGFWKTINQSPAMMQIVTDIFEFVGKTAKESKPMTCKIALINTADGKKESDFVSLWAGIGEVNPIDRCTSLKSQNTELIRLLELCLKGELPKEDEELIRISIKYFG